MPASDGVARDVRIGGVTGACGGSTFSCVFEPLRFDSLILKKMFSMAYWGRIEHQKSRWGFLDSMHFVEQLFIEGSMFMILLV